MKITKRQLRRLIREGYMKERYTDIQEAILDILHKTPEIAGLDLVARVQAYGWGDAPGAIPEKGEIFSILDILLEEDEVLFNVEEDRWSLSGWRERGPGEIGAVELDSQHEGMSLKQMPDAWQQILGTCLKDKK
jgi:hypothetical protein